MEENKPLSLNETPEKRQQKKKATTAEHVINILLIIVMVVGGCMYWGWKNNIHSINQYRCRYYVNKAAHTFDTNNLETSRSKVIGYLDKAIELDAEYWEAWYKKGCAYVYDNYNIDTSLICFQKSLQLMKTSDVVELKDHCYWFITYCLSQKNQLPEAVVILKEGLHEYPDHDELQALGIQLSEELLANSDDTTAMWNLSEAIWDVDRKCGLNLRRKCARLGNKQAQEWFIMKNYDWD